MGVADVALGGDAVRPEIVVGGRTAKARLEVVERGHRACVLGEYRPIAGLAEILPYERTIVERLFLVAPAALLQLVARQAAQHWHQVGISIVTDFVVAHQLDGVELPQCRNGLWHHAMKVQPRYRVQAHD